MKVVGPIYSMQRGLGKEPQHKTLVCCVVQDSSGEESDTEREKKIAAEKEAQVMIEEKLEETDLGMDPQKPRPISISSKLSKKEKLELILLLKEFKDVFTWDYSEMLGLDLELVVHVLNVDPRAKPMTQPAKVFHIEIKEQIIKEKQKLLAAGFIKPIQHPRWLSNIVPMKKKNEQI